MTWAVVQSATGQNDGTSVSATFTSNVQSGNKIIVVVGHNGSATVPTVKDGALNAWTHVAQAYASSKGVDLYALDVPSGDVGTKPVITATPGASSGLGICIAEVSGLLAGNTSAMWDGTPGTKTGTTASTGSPTYASAVANEFLVSCYGDLGDSKTVVKTTGWTLIGMNGSGDADAVLQYNNSTGGTETDGFTVADTGGWGVVMVAFQLASTGTSEPFTEAGAGSDSLAITQPTALAEAGAGSDSLAITAVVSLAEAGAGSDAFTAAIPTALTEAGSGADALGIAIPVALVEAGAGSDSLGVMPGLAEAGTGADALAITQPTPLPEAGSGTDQLAITQPTALAEAGAGADALTLAAQLPLAEAGAGTDTFTASIPTALAEAGAGSDALLLTQPTALADAGTGLDSLGVMPGLSEAGAGSDALSVTVASPVALTDAGTGSDALSLTQPTPLAEAGSGAAALAITQPTALSEAGSGTDALGVAIPVALTEAGAGADALTIVAASPVALSEAGSGADQLAVTQPTPLAEAGHGADALALIQPTALAEAGTGTDQLAIAIPVALAEAGSGADSLLLATPVPLTEAGSGADALSISSSTGPVTVTDTDSCSAAESEFAFVTSTEAGSAADGAEVIVVRDTDRCAMAERELTAWPHDTDACRAAEAGWQSGPVAGGTETCIAAEHGERIRLASSETCSADDEAPDIDVYTYVPPFRTGPGGGWYKVEHGGRTVVASRLVDGALLRFAAEFGRAREVRFVTDADACGSAEAHRQPVGVMVSVVAALDVSVQVSPITRGMNPGQTLLVRVTAASAGRTVTDGPVTAEFWAPGCDPERDPAWCEAPCVYDERTRRWLAWVDTAGWSPGMWTVRGAVRGELSGWGWTTFPLAA